MIISNCNYVNTIIIQKILLVILQNTVLYYQKGDIKMSQNTLNNREKEIMDILWSNHNGFTSNELLELLGNEKWNKLSIHRTINSLEKKGYLKVIGFEKYNTQYARRFTYAITQEEYAAKILCNEGMKLESLGKIALAFVKENSSDKCDSEELLNTLQPFIDALKDSAKYDEKRL